MARKILLADDSVTAQNMGRRILTDAGYEVVTVNNGSAALKKIAEQKPDLIVLDVYMPGYGGLEVCARLKENKDTARIPVLLSVGKLEPFKAEEARRVRAEGYIVKPFEASELLTALTRLEDKIVPGPEPYKQGRFAKAIAAVEEGSESGDQFGDKESGWKDRLTIPKRSKKKNQPADEKEIAEVRTFPQDKDKPVEPPREFQRPIPAGLPEDITPEEISAITAAAAALNKHAGAVEEAPAVQKPATAEPVPAADSSAPVEQATATFAPQAQSVMPADQSMPAVIAQENAVPASESPSTLDAEESEQKPTDAEVLAALAMLGAPGSERDVANNEAAIAAYTGPRWIAEEVAPEPEESTFILEREMEKCYAAMAAVQGAHTAATLVAEAPPAAIEQSSGESSVTSVSVVSQHAAIETQAVEQSTPAISEYPVAAEETTAVAESSAGNREQDVQPKEISPVVSEQTPVELPMAFAAAASADPSLPANAMTPEMTPSPVTETAVTLNEGHGDSELASAWANWNQIRENVVGSENAPSLSEPAPEAVAGMEESQSQAGSQADTESQNPASASTEGPEESEGGEAEAISNIVDNMLAELKPKLMEELSKKLSKKGRKK